MKFQANPEKTAENARGLLYFAAPCSLHKAYCSSIFGCELWLLDSCSIEKFCVACRKGLRCVCVLNIPRATHNQFLPLLSVCQSTMRYVNDLQGLLRPVSVVIIWWNLVKSVVNYGILARCHSVVGRNVMLLSRRYAGLCDQLVSFNYCCEMLILWLVICQLLLVICSDQICTLCNGTAVLTWTLVGVY